MRKFTVIVITISLIMFGCAGKNDSEKIFALYSKYNNPPVKDMLKPVWKKKFNEEIIPNPVIFGNKIVVVTRKGIYVLDKNGNLLWKKKFERNIEDFVVNSKGIYVIMEHPADVYAFSWNGEALWNRKLGEAGGELAIGDIEADGRQELAVNVDLVSYILSADNGEILREVFTGGAVYVYPILTDINADGYADLVSRYEAISLKDGKTIWELDTMKYYGFHFPAVTDMNGDGIFETVVSGEKEVILINGKGDILWKFKRKERVFAPAVADLNGDGIKDVVVGSENSWFYAISGINARLIWKQELLDFEDFSVQAGIADLNNDGIPDIVTGDSYLYVFKGNSGKFLWKTEKPLEGYLTGAISMGDPDGNLRIDVLLYTTENYVYLFESRFRSGLIFWAWMVRN